jgi:hypothetical protein
LPLCFAADDSAFGVSAGVFVDFFFAAFFAGFLLGVFAGDRFTALGERVTGFEDLAGCFLGGLVGIHCGRFSVYGLRFSDSLQSAIFRKPKTENRKRLLLMPSPPQSFNDEDGELSSGPAKDPDGGWCNGVNSVLFRCERIMDHRSAKGVAVPFSLLLFSPLGDFAIVDTG